MFGIENDNCMKHDTSGIWTASSSISQRSSPVFSRVRVI